MTRPRLTTLPRKEIVPAVGPRWVRSRQMLGLTLGLALLGGAQAQTAPTTTHVQLILDASGSMLEKLPDGKTRIDTAKQVLTQFLGGLQPAAGLNVGLRIYGAGLGSAQSCQDSKLAVPMSGLNKPAIQQLITSTRPRGATPIVYSLLQAAKDFPTQNSRNLIVLVTDGEESCGGKFAEVISAFKSRGIEVDLRIIGIDLNDRAKKSFAGVGTFENVRSGAELGQALSRATAPAQSGTYKLSAPQTAAAGSVIQVRWTGPNNPGDYVTIVKKGAAEGKYNRWFYTKNGNPGTLQTPTEPGDYEIRYSSERANPNPTLASVPIKLTASAYTLSLPARLGAGDDIQVRWTGPNNPGDYVTVVTRDAQDGAYWDYFYTRNGNPGTLRLPTQPGNYEVRYATENTTADSPNATLYRLPITVTPTAYRITAPTTARPGSTLTVQISGPQRSKEYLTIVPKDANDGAYTDYFYTNSNTRTLKVPSEPGEYEIRWALEGGKPVSTLHSVPLTVR